MVFTIVCGIKQYKNVRIGDYVNCYELNQFIRYILVCYSYYHRHYQCHRCCHDHSPCTASLLCHYRIMEEI